MRALFLPDSSPFQFQLFLTVCQCRVISIQFSWHFLSLQFASRHTCCQLVDNFSLVIRRLACTIPWVLCLLFSTLLLISQCGRSSLPISFPFLAMFHMVCFFHQGESAWSDYNICHDQDSTIQCIQCSYPPVWKIILFQFLFNFVAMFHGLCFSNRENQPDLTLSVHPHPALESLVAWATTHCTIYIGLCCMHASTPGPQLISSWPAVHPGRPQTALCGILPPSVQC